MKKSITAIGVLLMLAIAPVQASEFVEKVKEVVINVKLTSVLAGKHENSIQALDFSKDARFLSLSRGVINLWDLEAQELISTLQDKGNYISAKFSDDGNVIYVMSRRAFAVHDSKTLKKLWNIEGTRFSSFSLSKDEKRLFLQDSYFGKLYVYDLEKKSKLYTVNSKGSAAAAVLVSPNDKYMAITTYSEVNVYRVMDGALVSSLKPGNKLMKSYFSTDSEITLLYKNNVMATWNFKTVEELQRITYPQIMTSYVFNHDRTKAIFVPQNKNTLNLFDLKLKKTIKRSELHNSRASTDGVVLSKDNSLLAIGFENGDFKVYSTKNLFESRLPSVKKTTVQSATPMPLPVIAPVSIPKEAPLSPPKTDVPAIMIHASTKNGITPLEVVFTILTTNDDQIDSYYLNLAGEESVKKGGPPTSIKKVFDSPGSFEVLIALKTKSGEIVKAVVTVTARDETFSDFKKTFQ